MGFFQVAAVATTAYLYGSWKAESNAKKLIRDPDYPILYPQAEPALKGVIKKARAVEIAGAVAMLGGILGREVTPTLSGVTFALGAVANVAALGYKTLYVLSCLPSFVRMGMARNAVIQAGGDFHAMVLQKVAEVEQAQQALSLRGPEQLSSRTS